MIYLYCGLCLYAISGGSLLAAENHLDIAAMKVGEQQTPIVKNKQDQDCHHFSMDELVDRLKKSKAIGFFTKLAIRSDVIGFQQTVRDMKRKKKLNDEMSTIKANFNGLLLKIMALLEKDPDLSKKIYLARHSIFKSLVEVPG